MNLIQFRPKTPPSPVFCQKRRKKARIAKIPFTHTKIKTPQTMMVMFPQCFLAAPCTNVSVSNQPPPSCHHLRSINCYPSTMESQRNRVITPPVTTALVVVAAAVACFPSPFRSFVRPSVRQSIHQPMPSHPSIPFHTQPTQPRPIQIPNPNPNQTRL